MIRTPILFFILVICLQSIGISNDLDSIYTSIENHNNKDKIKKLISCYNYGELSLNTQLSCIDSALNISIAFGLNNFLFDLYMLKAKCLLKQKDYKNSKKNLDFASENIDKGNIALKAELNLYYGSVYRDWGESDIAMKYYLAAIEYYNALSDSNELQNCYTGIAGLYFKTNDYNNALEYLLMASVYTNRRTNEQILAGLNNKIAITYDFLGNYTEAIKHLLIAINYLEDNPHMRANILMNLALLYSKFDKFDLSLEKYHEAYSFFKIVDSLGMAATCANLAILHDQIGNIDSSAFYYLKADSIYIKLNNTYEYAINKKEYSKLLIESGNYDLAESSLREVLIIAKEINDKKLEAEIHIQFVNLYNKSNPKLSLKHLQTANKLAVDMDTPFLLKTIYKGFADYYEIVGSSGQALLYYKKFIMVKDSIESLEQKNKFEELITRYETREKEKKNKLLKSHLIISKQETRFQKTQKLFYIVAFVSTLLGIVIIVVILRNRIKSHKAYKELSLSNTKVFEQALEINGQKQMIAEESSNKLKSELEFKKKELEQLSSLILKHSEMAGQLLKNISNLRPYCNHEGKSQINTTLADFTDFNIEQNWKDFKTRFLNLHEGFFKTLYKSHPDLTENEIRLATFMKMNLKTKEIASITFQSVNSINVAKNRLRNKFNFETNEEFYSFIDSF